MTQPGWAVSYIREESSEPGHASGFSFAMRVVVDMDAREFVFMCGTIASKHDTALAHAMLHAVAVWVDRRSR